MRGKTVTINKRIIISLICFFCVLFAVGSIAYAEDTAYSEIEVPNVINMRLDEGIATLTDAGFTNVWRYDTDWNGIYDNFNEWQITSQDHVAGTVANSDDMIILLCISAQDYFKETQTELVTKKKFIKRTEVNIDVFLILLILISPIVIAIAILIVELKWDKKVKNKSESIAKLIATNAKYTFFDDVEEHYTIEDYVNTKTKFDNYNVDKKLMEIFRSDLAKWSNIFSHAIANGKNLVKYKVDVSNITVLSNEEIITSSGVPRRIFIRKEQKLFNMAIRKPRTEFSATFLVSYTSQKGQRSYSQSWNCPYGYLIREYEGCLNIMYYQTSFGYERLKLTQNLRYDVMRRDGFRCVICGRSAQDGVQLHVDHIKPVSKGGKTEMPNLRTLCADCNLGKGAKYDPSGIN